MCITIDGKPLTYTEKCDICGENLYKKTEGDSWLLEDAKIGINGNYHNKCKKED